MSAIRLGENAVRAIHARREALRAQGEYFVSLGVPPAVAFDPEALWQERYRAAAWHGTFCGFCGRDFAPQEPLWQQRCATEDLEEGVGHCRVTVPRCRDCASLHFRDKDMRLCVCAVCARPVYVTHARASYDQRSHRAVVCCGSHRRQRRAQQRRDRARRHRRQRRCRTCDEWFTAQRSTARFCSPRCRVANHRTRHAA